MNKPILSVIVPSYNQGRFLTDNLDELIKHRHAGVEAIVVDGGSTDSTLAILEKSSGDLEHWVSEKDRGQAHAINKGLARSTGKWLAFQNSDDFYLPGMLGHVLGLMHAHPDADIILGGTIFVDENGKPIRENMPKPIFYPALSAQNFINNQSLFINKKLADRIGPISENLKFCLDYDWFVRMFRLKPSVLYVHKIVGAQRIHGDTKTTLLGHVHDEEFEAISRANFSSRERVVGARTLQIYRAYRKLFGTYVKLRGKELTFVR